jgi:hypothetical protein
MTRGKKISVYQQILKTVKTKINLVNIILTVLCFAGLIITRFEINIYRKTIIDWEIPTSIWLFSGLIITPFSRNFLSKYAGTSGLFLQIVFNVSTWGGFLMYGFMALNYYSPDKEVRSCLKTVQHNSYGG